MNLNKGSAQAFSKSFLRPPSHRPNMLGRLFLTVAGSSQVEKLAAPPEAMGGHWQVQRGTEHTCSNVPPPEAARGRGPGGSAALTSAISYAN